jgi:RNA polymerase sigma-70 factor (ECF subfamily)
MQDILKETVSRAAGGDPEAFEEIFKTYFHFVDNVALRMLNNRQDAEEVTQEVFLNIHRQLKNFRFEASLKTWIYRITLNCAINYSKKRARQHPPAVEYNDALAGGPPEIHQTADREYHEKVIAALLNALEPSQRSCIILRSIEGLSYQDIARTLQIPINTVRSRIKRARETMLAMKTEVIKNEV